MIASVDLLMPDWLVKLLVGWLSLSVLVAWGWSVWWRLQHEWDERDRRERNPPPH